MGVLLCKSSYCRVIISCPEVICSGFFVKVFSAVTEWIFLQYLNYNIHYYINKNKMFSPKSKKIRHKSAGFFMVETAGLDKLLLRKILILC